jgi:hypothetical protein
MNLNSFFSSEISNFFAKLITGSIQWLQEAYFRWKEGAETGVGSPSNEDVPNNANQSSQFIECAGAFWKPYYIIDEGRIFLPIYLESEVGPFCYDCKAPVVWEGRTIFRPYFKWRCPNNHVHRIPKFFKKDLLARVKIQLLWDLKKYYKIL